MRSASAERSGSPRSNNVAVLEHRPALNRGDNSRSIHDPIRGRIDRLAEIQSKSDRLLEKLARIQSHDVVLPTTTHSQIRLRCVTQPDAAQATLLDRLGIILPKRMRLAEPQLIAIGA